MSTDDLLAYLFDGQPNLLSQPMARWIASSRRFAAFATTYQDKIRKKLRTTSHPEKLLDLQLELETAYLLLQERSFSVVYEPELSRRVRSPDFAVSFTTSLTFMLEVTRVQAAPQETLEARLADTISAKLGQLLPQRSNILLVGVEAVDAQQHDLLSALLSIQQRAERNDLAFFQRHGFRDRPDFFRHYQRVSEILIRKLQTAATPSSVAWINPQAKLPLPSKTRAALHRSQTA